MIQLPSLVGLKLCQEAIIEDTTKRVTLVNCFRRLWVPSFPSPKQEFKISLVLTDGMGDTELALDIKRMSSAWQQIYQRVWRVDFPNPLLERWYVLRVSCSFPESGGYQVGLSADNQVIGQSVFEVLKKGEKHDLSS